MYYFPMATITNCHKLGGLKHRNVLSHSSGTSGFKSKGWYGWTPSEGFGEGYFLASFSVR